MDDNNVEGPMNVIRLTGNIGKTNKTIYLFLDGNFDITSQKACTNIKSKNIKTYLTEQFDKIEKTKRKLHFFVNYTTTDIFDDFIHKLHDNDYFNYIGQVREVYKKLKNSYENVIFDVSNIQSLFKVYLTHISRMIDDRITLSKKNSDLITKQQLGNLYDAINLLFNNTKNINDLFLKNKSIYDETITQNLKDNFITATLDKDLEVKNFMKDINDIKNTYVHNEVKIKTNNFMEKYLNTYFEHESKTHYRLRENMKDELDNFNDTLIVQEVGKLKFPRYEYPTMSKYYNDIDIITKTTSEILERINDIFLLKKILDNDNITLAVVYTGIINSATLTKILVSDFNFKITNIAEYTDNPKNITQKINETKSPYDLAPLILPTKKSQCCNLRLFPHDLI